jgi:hypothetical protein
MISPTETTYGDCVNMPEDQHEIYQDLYAKGVIGWFYLESPTIRTSAGPSAALVKKYGADAVNSAIGILTKNVQTNYATRLALFNEEMKKVQPYGPPPSYPGEKGPISPPEQEPAPIPPTPWYKNWKYLLPIGVGVAAVGGAVTYRRRS